MSGRSTLVVLLILLTAVAINALYFHQTATGAKLLRPAFYDSDVNQHTGCDFYGLYTAGRALTSGGDIYRCRSLTQIKPIDQLGQYLAKTVFPNEPSLQLPPCCFNYRYLPVGAVLGVPFTWLKPEQARLAWMIFVELLALIGALLTLRMISGNEGAVMAALWLAASPVYLELYMGQFNMLQAVLLLAALYFTTRQKEAPAGIALGGALLWKLTAWAAAPALIVKRRWRTLAFAASIALLSTLVYWALAHQNLDTFWRNFLPGELSTKIYRGDLGLLMLLRVLLGKSAMKVLVYAVPVGVFALTLLITWLKRSANLADLLALWFVAYFFLYPTVWEHHYLMLLPPLIYFYSRTKSPVLWLAALLLALPTPYIWAGPHGANWHGFWPVAYHAVKPAGAALVYLTGAFAKR